MAAARAGVGGRRARRVVLVQDGPVGGDCTFTGCIPSKTLLAAAERGVPFGEAMVRVRAAVGKIAAAETAEVLRGEGIAVIEGRARFIDRRTVDVTQNGVGHPVRRIRARAVVIATGSAPLIPAVPGLQEALPLTNETVFDLAEPPATLLLLGGGPIGCELSQAFSRLGVPVTLVESGPRLLGKEEDEAGDIVLAALRRDGVDVRLDTSLQAVGAGGATLDDGTTVAAGAILVATGRRPVTEGLGLAEAGVATDARGWIATDAKLATSARNIWAAGDSTGGLQFTHAADEMGRVAAANATRRLVRRGFRTEAVPWVTFTEPEVGRVGVTEAQAATRYPGARVAYLPLSAVDRAVTMGREEGFIKLLAAPRRGCGHLGGGRIVGATVVSPGGGEVIAELALAVRTRMFSGRLAQTVHAYPTIALGVRSAAAQFVTEYAGRRARPARPPQETAAVGRPVRS